MEAAANTIIHCRIVYLLAELTNVYQIIRPIITTVHRRHES